MKKAILATKVGMTQIFNADGVLVPVTVLQAGPCVVTQIKTVDNDGYSAVQVGFVDKKEKTVNKDANGKKEIRNRHGVNKAQMGHFAKAGVSGKRFVREFKFEKKPVFGKTHFLSFCQTRPPSFQVAYSPSSLPLSPDSDRKKFI